MIEPVRLNANVQFRGDAENTDAIKTLKVENPLQKLQNNDVQAEQSLKQDVVELNNKAEEAPKEGLKDKFHNFKKTTTGVVKDFNTVTGTTAGVVRGIIDGSIVAGVVGLAGKNMKNAQGNIAGTLKGIGSDCWHGAGKAIKLLPKVWTQAPKDNVKAILSAPSKYYTQYLKGHKATAAIATVAAAGTLMFRTVQGKMAANMKNADVDHATNLGHV